MAVLQTSTTNQELVHALNELDYHLQAYKNADAWMDGVEALDKKLGCETVIDRELYKRVEANAVTLYAGEVVRLACHQTD